MTYSSFAHHLKELRKSRHYTQNYVSSQIHVTRSSYCNYENGIRTPTLESIVALAKFYNISIEHLIGITTCRQPTMQLSPEELFLIRTYRAMSKELRQEIISFILFKKQFSKQAGLCECKAPNNP